MELTQAYTFFAHDTTMEQSACLGWLNNQMAHGGLEAELSACPGMTWVYPKTLERWQELLPQAEAIFGQSCSGTLYYPYTGSL